MSVIDRNDRVEMPISSDVLLNRVGSFAEEWPTWGLIIGHYAAFCATIWFWSTLTAWLAVPILALLVCFNMHMMHEVIHGHPTRSRLINRLVVLPNLSLYIPYEIYREIHIAHHKTDSLTDPVDDPESFYVDAKTWQKLGRLGRFRRTVTNTLLGRILIGPIYMVLPFWKAEMARLLNGDFKFLGAWAILLLTNGIILTFALGVADVIWWQLALGFYLGLGIATVRAFIEHRPAGTQDERCAIVEAGPFMQLLFLNNSYHLIHHDMPSLSWYRIPQVYYADRDTWRARSGHLFSGYLEILWRYGFRPKDVPVHPGR